MSARGDAPLLDAFVAAFDGADESTRLAIASRLQPYLADDPNRLLDVKEKAKQVGLHPDTLARMAHSKRVPAATRAGKEWRFPAGEIDILPVHGGLPSAGPPPPLRRASAAGDAALAALRGVV